MGFPLTVYYDHGAENTCSTHDNMNCAMIDKDLLLDNVRGVPWVR